jgi:hypothetical protein
MRIRELVISIINETLLEPVWFKCRWETTNITLSGLLVFS